MYIMLVSSCTPLCLVTLGTAAIHLWVRECLTACSLMTHFFRVINDTHFLLIDWDGIRNLVSALPQKIKRLVLVSSIGVTKYNEIPWRYSLELPGRILILTVELHDIIVHVMIPLQQHARHVLCVNPSKFYKQIIYSESYYFV